jgi:hypothetical protein
MTTRPDWSWRLDGLSLLEEPPLRFVGAEADLKAMSGYYFHLHSLRITFCLFCYVIGSGREDHKCLT